MIHVSVSKTKSGHRLKVHNRNGKPFNHAYQRGSDARKAWNALVKQIKAGRFKFV